MAYPDPLQKGKMDAERPSDDAQSSDFDEVVTDDTLDRAIMTRPENLLSDLPQQVTDHSDSAGDNDKAEGVDLRIPDQQ